MHCEVSIASRNNWWIAKQKTLRELEGVDWLKKQSMQAFTCLRAGPTQQMRRICDMLRDNLVPLTEPAVRALIRQALHHVGPLTADGESLLWHLDADAHGLRNLLFEELNQRIQRTRDLVREADSELVVADLCSFICERAQSEAETAAASSLARSAGEMCLGWANIVVADRERAESLVSVDSKQIANLRGREALFLAYAFMCCRRTVPLSPEDAGLLLHCLVRFKGTLIFAQDTDLQKTLNSLENEAFQAICPVIRELALKLDDAKMTTALRSVYSEAPHELVWRSFGTAKIAQNPATGVLYAINFFTGEVLVDGHPLHSLPDNIRRSPLYKRSFGDRNFEAVREGSCWHTPRPLSGFLFSFTLGTLDNAVTIVEHDSQGNALELIDTSAGTWASQIPPRFREMHSFWANREKGIVVARGISFQHRTIALLSVDNNERHGVFVFPTEIASKHWTELLEMALKGQLSRLVNSVPRSLVSQVVERAFMRIEDSELIHLEISSARTLRFLLPRLNVSFEVQSNGAITSLDRVGYSLSSRQQLPELLSRFDSYLVLESTTAMAERKIIVPFGTIERDMETGFCTLKRPENKPAAHRESCSFDIHPRFAEFGAETTLARLHLAAIFAARSTLLAVDACGRPGAAVAIELVRRSFSWSPLTAEEVGKLSEIYSFSTGFPALAVLVAAMSRESFRLSALYPSETALPDMSKLIEESANAVSEYAEQASQGIVCAESRLLPREESCFAVSVPHRFCRPSCVAWDDVPELCASTEEELVRNVQNSVSKLVAFDVDRNCPIFPLSRYVEKDVLSTQLLAELRESWDLHASSKAPRLTLSVEETSAKLKSHLETVVSAGNGLFLRMHSTFDAQFEPHAFNPSIDSVDLAHKRSILPMNWAAHTRALLTASRIIEMVIGTASIEDLFPLLGTVARSRFIDCAFAITQLWILEDKIRRLLALVSDPEQLLSSYAGEFAPRSWDVRKYPRWLAFEAVNRIGIRREQFALAVHLLSNQGSIVQLNMGLGKTRVVLPLILLEQTRNCDRLVRVTFLSPLLHEGSSFLHRTLTASIFHQPLLELPFSRSTDSSEATLRAYVVTLKKCRELGGFIAIAPEHRLSLCLKHREAEIAGSALTELFARSTGAEAYDIVDESDAVLHPKYELVYAVGKPKELSSGPVRYAVIQAVLRVLNTAGEPLRTAMERDPSVVVVSHHYPQGSFRPLRFIAGGLLEARKPEIKRALANQLCSAPPFELRWIKKLQPKSLDLLIQCISDASSSIDVDSPMISSIVGTDDEKKEQVLALRGAIAHEVIFSALEKRHRVDYGVDTSRKPPRLLAVPFRASDSPAARAEFNHADTVLVFTCLSYDYTGLTWPQMRQALLALLELPSSAAVEEYELWLKTIGNSSITPNEFERINAVNRIDVTSDLQKDILIRAFCRSTEAVNWWLFSTVFPREVSQFPGRLKQTAWHLVGSGTRTTGFSGTNDIQRMLPLTVLQAQRIDGDDTIASTNGRMLNVILSSSDVLALPPGCNTPLFRQVLDCAITESSTCCALIDTGALLAGITNADAASYMCKKLPNSFHGVVFYGDSCWMVLEREGRLLPLGSSPVHERDSFVIFDEAHSRGADMKLRPRSRALITLGPRMTKDKFMQGAGRMRALGHGQTLHIVVSAEVANSICQQCHKPLEQPIVVIDVLHWVFQNTVNTNKLLLPHWAESGSHYSHTIIDNGVPQEPDGPSLRELYADQHHCIDLSEIASKHVKSLKVPLPSIASHLSVKCREYSASVSTSSHSLEEECERELEHEREQEKEKEEEIPLCEPDEERVWDVSRLHLVQSVSELANMLPLRHLSAILNGSFSPKITKMLKTFIDVSSADVWVSSNFVDSVHTWTAFGKVKVKELDTYLRFPGSCLLLPNKCGSNTAAIVLLAELEADRILQCMHQLARVDDGKSVTGSIAFAGWSSIRCKAGVVSRIPDCVTLGPNTRSLECNSREIAAIQLFCGEAQLVHDSSEFAKRKAALMQLLRPQSTLAVVSLMQMRHTAPQYQHSQLQEVVESVPPDQVA